MTDDQANSEVTCHIADAVATITMTTPSLGSAAKRGLLDCVQQVTDDASVRAVVLTGTGRVFSAGQDLAEHADALAAEGEPFATIEQHYNPVVIALATMPKPVIAAINGTCAGAGLGLALACDLRVAVAGTKFVTAFSSIGLTPDSGLSASLARAVGAARASELILLADAFTAEDALAWGMIGRIADAADFDTTIDALAHRLAAGPTRAYATSKVAIRNAWAAGWDDVLAREVHSQTALGSTTDHRDAVSAFLSKSRPTFTGR
ncbi:enoyl-CoA hydratase/isomerase family protein [uncultured Jatrophihabitans sp.]|uniref:enoyl-CoA hydratase/isomerase family protein n=1 Tax=uncultured Jatrophihabitans sp. TaxID=1610747 RepID=UPI0035C9AE59